MEIEKDKFYKINKYSYLCRVRIWGSEDKEENYIYAVAINSYPSCIEFSNHTIYGFGKTSEEALLMAIGQLTECSLQSIPFDSMEDMTLKEVMSCYLKKDGHICTPKKEPMANLSEVQDEEKKFLCKQQPFVVEIKNGKAMTAIS